jgi:hypothetical protein
MMKLPDGLKLRKSYCTMVSQLFAIGSFSFLILLLYIVFKPSVEI